MTVITVTTVGFQEVRALSEPGRDFTMVLLAGGITGVGIWFALITSFIVEFDLSHVRRKRWRARMLERVEGHVVLCGGGRTGLQVMEEPTTMNGMTLHVEGLRPTVLLQQPPLEAYL